MSFDFMGRRHEPLPLPPTLPLLPTRVLLAAPFPAAAAALQALLPDLPSSQRMGNEREALLVAYGLENPRGIGGQKGPTLLASQSQNIHRVPANARPWRGTPQVNKT